MARIGFLQNHPSFGAVDRNLEAARGILADAGGEADLWVFPELFASGYLMGTPEEASRLSERIPDGPTTRWLIGLARDRKAGIVAGLPERGDDGRVYNSAVAVDPSGVRGVYRKIHLFDREKEWFTPGGDGFAVLDLAGMRVGVMICFDWRFPEAARTLTLLGAQVLAHPSNLVHPWCQAAMVTRALENRVFAITANRIGGEDRAGSSLLFTGGSRIVAPDGRILADAPTDGTAAAIAEIDPRQADDKHATPANDLLADRRPEFYTRWGRKREDR